MIMRSTADKDLLIAAVIFVVVIAIFAPVVYFSEVNIEKQRIECEKINGVLLDRTYQVGKSTGHNYTCVDKKMILN